MLKEPHDELDWGTVKITGGPHKGRIGIYDDDQTETMGIVYFGDLVHVKTLSFIPHKYLAPVTSPDLLTRRDVIYQKMASAFESSSGAERADLLAELLLIDNALSDRMMLARLTSGQDKKLFISHSSVDKPFATCLAVDLTKNGHPSWLDEWEITVGQSIPTRVSDGLDACDAIIVVLSEHSVKSKWVENEWQAKYWDEVQEGKVKVLPVLFQNCKIPTLLKAKKYADFTTDYNKGLASILLAL